MVSCRPQTKEIKIIACDYTIIENGIIDNCSNKDTLKKTITNQTSIKKFEDIFEKVESDSRYKGMCYNYIIVFNSSNKEQTKILKVNTLEADSNKVLILSSNYNGYQGIPLTEWQDLIAQTK